MIKHWRLSIDRVVVSGVTGPALGAGELHALIEAAVRTAVADAALPTGRSMRTAVQVQAPALGSAQAIAQAVGSGVAQAVRGGRSHG